MKNKQYKFSIDEPAPQIPPAGDFTALITKVKTHVPWYSKISVIGGVASTVVVAVSALVYLGQTSKENNSKTPSAAVVASNTMVDAELDTVSKIIAENPFKTPPSEQIQRNTPTVRAGEEILEEGYENAYQGQIYLNMDAATQGISIQSIATKTEPWTLSYPFDTINVDIAKLPARFNLRNYGYLWIQKSSFIDPSGNPITGRIQLLYRDIRDAAAMIVSQTMLEESGINVPINNGAFELRVAHASVIINEAAPLYLSFLPNQKLKNNQGYKLTHGSVWELLTEAGLNNNSIQAGDSRNHKVDSIPSRLNFWQFMVSVFTGKDMHQYEVYEHSDYTSDNQGAESLENGLRTYEIREFGHYANGWNYADKKIQQRDVLVKSYHKDAFQPLVYQVFAGENRVRKITPDSVGRIHLEFTSKDRCYLMIPLKNAKKFAVYDANNFDRVVKYGTQKQIVVRTQAAEILTIEQLRALMRKYESQKLPNK